MAYEFGFYNFLFPDELQDPCISLSCMGIEQRWNTDYYFDNRDRNIDSYLFQYTLKGEGIYESHGKRFRLKPGQGFFIHIPDDEKYYMPADTTDQPWEFIFLLLRGDSVSGYYELITKKAGKILDLPLQNSAIQTLFDLYNQTQSGRMFHPFLASEFAYRFLCRLCQSVIHNEADYSNRTQAAIKIMETQYATIEGIERIAGLLDISPNHLTREFTRETGVPPIKYLTNIRLQQAAALLLETALPVHHIAVTCGFSCGNYFTKIFRKHMNATPQEYRREWK